MDNNGLGTFLALVALVRTTWAADRRVRAVDGAVALLTTSLVSFGLLALGVLKVVPVLGGWAWITATFLGVGASLVTKLGRREPWLDLEELDRLPGVTRI